MIRQAFFIFLFTLGLITWSSTARPANFTVNTASDTDCSDFDCKLQNALDVAAVNNVDDTIEISHGTFTPTSTYTYISNQDNALAILGSDSGVTRLSGNTSKQVLHIETDLSNTRAHITVKNLTFIYGYHSSEGGGLYIRSGSSNISMDNCTFQSNSTNSPNGGGGAYIRGSSRITITNSLFDGNSSNAVDSRGGGLYLHGSVSSYVTITGNSFLNNNTVSGGSGSGAYIRNIGGHRLMVTHNIFKGNAIPETGAGGALRLEINSSYELCSVVNNVFIDNSAAKAETSDWAASAALIYNDLAGVTFSSNTVTRNEGNGAAAVRIEAAGADIYNNIIWGNTTALDLKVTDGSIPLMLYYNDLSSKEVPATAVEVNNIDADPLFALVTIHLTSGSPAIDSGVDFAPGMPFQDIEGNDRILDGDSNGTARIDMGADEYKPVPSNCLVDGYCNAFCPMGHDLDCNPGIWYERAMIHDPSKGDSDTKFGARLVLNNNTLAVSAPHEDRSSIVNAGAVYIFERTSEDIWVHQATVDAGNWLEENGHFGNKVVLEGDWLVVADERGSVFVFNRNSGGRNVWGRTEILGHERGGLYGAALALNNNILAVGAPTERPTGWDFITGAVHVYQLNEASSLWSNIQYIVPPHSTELPLDLFESADFGYSISMHNNFMVISAPFFNSGKGAFFTYSGGAGLFNFLDVNFQDFPHLIFLGVSTAVNGHNLAVTQAASDYTDYYTFWYSYTGTSDYSSWLFEKLLLPSPPFIAHVSSIIELSDNYLIVSGEDLLSVYYRHSPSLECNQQIAESIGPSESFGNSISVDGGILAVSASGGPYDYNRVYIYQLPGSELPDPGPIPADYTEAETFLDTINTGETNSHQLNVQAVTGMSVILSFSSEFNIKVYGPDGSLFTERQSTTSPITISIDSARAGDWKFDVTAISTSRPDRPYSLVIAFGESSEEFPWEIFYPAFIKKYDSHRHRNFRF